MRKRFIAGATCPKCQEQDSIQVYMSAKGEIMECVCCGYQQTQTPPPTPTKGEIIGVFKPK
ncbi:MAG: YheV family putative zinc ribbon protein [Ferrimonas sp.]